ncbi:hypothetical protein DDB_G0286287 [Dictyostelium discoideum AX4]|uniref:Uncharacterized protein n=1 Tax=Dictyostelium discoideum TaxID=44689 RepID=Q54LZ7_DICDI|nr:hypothetical protein DDB_G0286287 [Dictyostelium discoideum AX4]EAL64319.1 hypothetical protein DDB_G0286287 [Dictyostelium discoideum AX4]|eukprot:XP_637834.1 hypothetical protein DDB_G0286287 [Dictyostelium discoideum AX4]
MVKIGNNFKFCQLKGLLQSEEVKEIKELPKSNFYTQGIIEAPISIRIDDILPNGINYLSIPCVESQINSLISNDNITTNSNRNVWEIESKKIEIGDGNLWKETEEKIIEKIKIGMGIYQDELVNLQFKKLIIIKPNGYLPYQDINTTTTIVKNNKNNIFGKLLISLPSKSYGGDIIITNSKNDKDHCKIQLSNNFGSLINMVSFYSDCIYTTEPLQSGIRVYLEYDLIKSSKRSLSAQVLTQIKSDANEKLKEITDSINFCLSDGKLTNIVYLFENGNYNIESIVEELSGNDLKIVEKVNKISMDESNDLTFCFGYFHLIEKSIGLFSMDEKKKFTPNESVISENFIHCFRDINNNLVDIPNIHISKDLSEVLSSIDFKNFKPYQLITNQDLNSQISIYEIPSLIIFKKSTLENNDISIKPPDLKRGKFI